MNFNVPPKGVKAPDEYFNILYDKKVKTIKDTYNKYGTIINFASRTSKLPESVILGFIIAASNGDYYAGGDGFKRGLMKWDRRFARQVLENEAAQGRLSPAEIDFLKQSNITIDKNKKLNRDIQVGDQLNGALNIVIGSIILGQLFDEKWANDQAGLRMDKVAAVYYSGTQSDAGKQATTVSHPTINNYLSVIDTPTRNFITKIIGTGGTLQIIKDDFPNIK
jgi:hypothetical protein